MASQAPDRSEAAPRIRRATAADVSRLVEMNAHVHDLHVAAHPEIFRPSSDRPGIEAFFTGSIDDPDQVVFVAEVDGALAGYLSAEIRRQPAHTFTHATARVHVDQVEVDPPYRRRGVGRALFAAVEGVAEAVGIDEITLETWAFNKDAQRFFADLGFSPWGVRMWKRGVAGGPRPVREGGAGTEGTEIG